MPSEYRSCHQSSERATHIPQQSTFVNVIIYERKTNIDVVLGIKNAFVVVCMNMSPSHCTTRDEIPRGEGPDWKIIICKVSVNLFHVLFMLVVSVYQERCAKPLSY